MNEEVRIKLLKTIKEMAEFQLQLQDTFGEEIDDNIFRWVDVLQDILLTELGITKDMTRDCFYHEFCNWELGFINDYTPEEEYERLVALKSKVMSSIRHENRSRIELE